MNLDDMIERTRKENDWEQIQDFEKINANHNIIIKPKLLVPRDEKVWKEVDEKVMNNLKERARNDKEQNVEDQMAMLKDVVYSVFEEECGVKKTGDKRTKKQMYVDEEKKKMRKLKNEAKHHFKRAMRQAEGDEALLEHKKRWRNLVRVHNKLRKHEIAINNREEIVQNNTDFQKYPFRFIKEHVTVGKKKY